MIFPNIAQKSWNFRNWRIAQFCLSKRKFNWINENLLLDLPPKSKYPRCTWCRFCTTIKANSTFSMPSSAAASWSCASSPAGSRSWPNLRFPWALSALINRADLRGKGGSGASYPPETIRCECFYQCQVITCHCSIVCKEFVSILIDGFLNLFNKT